MLTQDELEKLRDYLIGTCISIGQAMEYLGLEGDITEVEAELSMLDISAIEVCPACGWWVYGFELLDDENEPAVCTTCREGE